MSPVRTRSSASKLKLPALFFAVGWVSACNADAPEAASPAHEPLPEAGTPSLSAPTPFSEELRSSRPVLAATSEVAVDQGDAAAQVRQAGGGRVVVVYFPSDGWSYIDGEGNLTGASVEILRDFFRWVEARERVRLDVTWAADDDWARFYRRVRNGSDGVFGIGNVTITQQRRGELDFSPPYLNNVAVLITHSDVPEIASLEDAREAFEGFTAFPYRGTLHEERVNRLRELRIPGLRVIPVESNEEILETVSTTPDGLAWIDVYAYWKGVENGLPLRRHPAGDDASETFGVVLPRGSDWTPLLEAFFEEGEGYRNQPRYVDHLRTHLGETVADLLEEARASREALNFELGSR
jgi:ABC-type amino acid transport substrate-binding protein